MKKASLKKIFALMLALALAFAMSVPAFAATKGDGEDDFTIIITPGAYTDIKKTDRYKAYEIFTGKLTEAVEDKNDDDKIDENDLTDYEKNQLSNIKWGEDIDVARLVAALTADDDNPFGEAFNGIDELSAAVQAAEVAGILSENGNPPESATTEQKAAAEAFAKAFAIAAQKSLKPAAALGEENDSTKSHPVASEYDEDNKVFTISLDKAGYYLTVDDPSDDPKAAKGDIISEHILQVVRDRKVGVKSGTPTVDKEIVGGKTEYEIGEAITFQIVGTLAENFKNFVGAYQYKFIDIMSDGLTPDEDSFKVEVWSVKADGSLDAKQDITLAKGDTAPNGNYTVTVATGDFDEDASTEETKITIAFDDLKEIANLKSEYVLVVTYEACINGNTVIGTPETNEVYLEFSNDPYTEDSTTETPEIEVEVETFEIGIIKKDSVTDAALEGVKFHLYKEIEITGETSADPTAKTLYGVFENDGNGTYTLKTEGGWTEYEDDAAEGRTDGATATDLITAAGGVLNIKGLAPGTYYLKETEALQGYNDLPGAIKITISHTYYTEEDDEVTNGSAEAGQLKGVTAAFTIDGKTSELVNVDTEADKYGAHGYFTFEVFNVPASSVPITGGIGVYIFYIGGALLIIAAAALFLVSKKKAAKD